MLRKLLILGLALGCGLISAALTLRIVRNSQTTSVPNLTGRTLAVATNEAAERRLRVKVSGRKNHAEIGAGRVIEQDPSARRQLDRPVVAATGRGGTDQVSGHLSQAPAGGFDR